MVTNVNGEKRGAWGESYFFFVFGAGSGGELTKYLIEKRAEITGSTNVINASSSGYSLNYTDFT